MSRSLAYVDLLPLFLTKGAAIVRWVTDERLKARSLELLFAQSTSAFTSSAVAGVVLVYTFWSVSDPAISVVWAGGYAAVACFRIYLRRAFNGSTRIERSMPYWYSKMAISVFLTGMLWGGFLLYLASFAEGFLAAMLMANLAFLMAGAVPAYAISLPMFLLFSLPIVVPSVLYLAIVLKDEGWLLSSVSLGWYLFMVSTARRFGEFATRALGYEYENVALVAELEEQNRRAEVLAEELIVLSNTDSLTGVFNRRYFDERVENELQRAHRLEAPLSLILADVDFFKIYNDSMGHMEGDKCLRKVSDILGESIRGGTDVVARYGGEEFAIILANTNLEQAKVYAERLRTAVAHCAIPHPKSAVGPYVTLSLGVAVLREGEDVEALIERADQALYRAKENGRDQVQLEDAASK